MALRAVEHVFSGTTTPYTAYDSTKTTLGKWIVQNTGVNNIDKWAGPCPVSVFPVSDLILLVQAAGGMNIGGGKHALFLPDVSTAAATTRRIYLIIYVFSR
jgi:hypothetical protein